jgi:hypothetical protein
LFRDLYGEPSWNRQSQNRENGSDFLYTQTRNETEIAGLSIIYNHCYTVIMNLKQKKTVYFVRHGQSVDNASPVFQSINSPLSKKGERQAKNIAERLSSLQFETLIASPV